MDELKLQMNMDEYLPLRDVVFNTLRQGILTGALKPGERLMEIHLADKLGVSRTPIREAIRIYVYQLMVNFLWPTFFFNFGWYLFAFLWLLLLWVLVLIMIVKFKDISKLAAYMNIPYLLWLTFAAYLNFAIWLLN